MNNATSDAAIGVFDSGVGGLTVLRAIREQLPFEKLLYVADSGHAPYGERDAAYIANRCTIISDYLIQQPVKALVVACNTASVLAIDRLRNEFDVPIVGIEPAIKPAASVTRSGVVGVLATQRTVQSPGVKRLCELYGQGVEVILQPCPGLVEVIERGELNTQETIQLLTKFLSPLLEAGADTIVLGCTHYPFLREAIQSIVGNAVTVIEPGAAVARQLGRRLDELCLKSIDRQDDVEPEEEVTQTEFYSTGKVGNAASIMSSLWGKPVAVRYLEDL